eukprot:SAG31_NODE_1922_length_6916_cov_3.724219_3_plen_139_part_00
MVLVQNKILSIVAVVFCVIGLLMDFVYQKDIGDGCALIDALTDPTDPVVAEVDFCDSAGALRACLGIQAVVAVRVVPNLNIELFGVRSEHARSFCSLWLLVFCARPHAAAAEKIRTTLVSRILSAKKGLWRMCSSSYT